MKILISKGVTQPKGESFDGSWEEFCDMARRASIACADESEETKRAAPWFSCALYKGDYRLRENIIGNVWAIVADLDDVRDPEAVEAALSKWEYIAWTTWKSAPDAQRWRIVLPIRDGGVTPERFGALARRILAPIAKHASIDVRSYLCEQLWFLPVHKRSQARNHTVWTNTGIWVRDSEVISVDFTGVKLAHKPEELGKGERNSSLVIYLSDGDALRCESRSELLDVAMAWNARLTEPMSSKEVSDIVRKKWDWMQRGEGLTRRAELVRQNKNSARELPEIGVGLMSHDIKTATLPDSIVGDFLYPGATMISAKMKEGKTFLTMQLSLSIATGTPFLRDATGRGFPGFPVKEKKRVVIIAGEDTPGGISSRFMGSIAAGHLPTLERADDVKLVFNDDLDVVRASAPAKVSGLTLFESLVDRWYTAGYRVIALDPLRVLESALGIAMYPGTVMGMNVHAKDFQTMRYYTKVAQSYEDLCIIVSMHHGKNKRDHDATDPGDMIAGTTGFGAGALTTISLLPIPEQLEAEESSEGVTPKRRELYLHGRYTREQRVLIEQSATTGVWMGIGAIAEELISQDRGKYMEALINLKGNERWVTATEIAKAIGRVKEGAVHKMLSSIRRKGEAYLGWSIMRRKGPGGGYRLRDISGEHAVRRRDVDD